MRERLLALLLRPRARPWGWGVVVAVALIAAEVVIVHQLRRVAPDNAFGAVFLLGVLVVSAGWGFVLAVATSVASALVYVYIHLEGADSLVPAAFVFLPLALLTNVLVGQARLRAAEAEERAREADLAAELARVMLRAAGLERALDNAGQRMASVLDLPYATLCLGEVTPDDGQQAISLHDDAQRAGTLLVPAGLSRATQLRVNRVVPSLEALLAAAQDREERLHEAQRQVEQSHAEVSARAHQQAALRRVATLVARGAPPAQVYPVAVAELARGLRVSHVTLATYEADDCVVLAALDDDRPHHQPGQRFSLDGDSVCLRVRDTGQPSRIDDYSGVPGTISAHLRSLGLSSGVGAPVIVDNQIRGALIAGSSESRPLPPETEVQVSDFADLVATAILNAENRAELTASRARIVAAADQARRRFERDLHDGAQQRIVSLGLQVRGAEATLPPDETDVRAQLTQVVDGLSGLYTDLQELSRGIHPAILSKGGLGPAIKTLARRSTVPVDLELAVDRRLPESIEVAAYYVVAEALTNVAKHAQAAEVTVRATVDNDALTVVVADDGVGGAVSGDGSGLIGLKDRVEALSGRLDVASASGSGTTLTASIPLPD